MTVLGTPVPQGRYVPARRFGDLVFTSGMTPRRDGVLTVAGKIGAAAALEDWKDAVVLAAANALAAARSAVGEGEDVTAILNMTVFVAAEPDFTLHTRLADFASDYFFEQLGPAGIGSRAAVGVASLPSGSPVEIQLVAVVGSGLAIEARR